MLSGRVTVSATLLSTLFAGALLAAVPTPREHFGFTPGDDYKLANYQEVSGYFQKLAASSDRIKLVEFGKSSEGRAMYVAFLSSAENLKKLDHYREINRKLALGLASKEEAAQLSAEGKAIVWIDSGLHATEVAPVQQAPHLAYRMVTDESAEVRRIRENVILMQIPVINPDGLDLTVSWYRRNVGTPHELAPLPVLYQKYAGHDNNRDWFMLNLPETRAVSRLLFRQWYPHIVYNQHQVAPFPARIFIPPYAEPLNPNIPAPVMEGINLIGAAMKERFARENKPGAISYISFDAWWNGGLRSAPAFHNMHGILTETALHQYATPKTYKASEIPERFSTGIPAKQPSVFYEKPWLGGRWALMDAVEYMLTADFAILDLAASRPAHYLRKAWELATTQMEAGKAASGPFGYVVPADQPDSWVAVEMLRRLQGAGIEVRRATAGFTANGKSYPSGAWLLLASQPFRGYLVDLMEPQKYPEIRAGQTGPTKRPYDLAGWTLPYQMGVQFDRLEQAAAIQSELVPDLPAAPAPAAWRSSGATPRVALYEPWLANMDTGWTQWVLDYFQIGHSALHNPDIRAGNLRARFDTIILAQQPMNSILHGTRQGEGPGGPDWQTMGETKNVQRPEYTGGIGLEGARRLQEFVEAGGTLIALDSATELPLALFPIGARGVLRGGEGAAADGWFCPGSILRITTDPAHPVAKGMPKEAYATSTGGQGFDITMLPEFNRDDREVKAVAWYAKKDLLASGWLSGERTLAGRAAVVDARLGRGHVVLFGFRPQFRGQSFGTFRLLLNAIYQSVPASGDPRVTR